MVGFVQNIFLALAWAALAGQFSFANLAFGFFLGWAVLKLLGPTPWVQKARQVIAFIFLFVGSLILANINVAISVFAPLSRLRPAIIALPLDTCTDAEITLLANLITLTPGTLSLDVAHDRTVLYVHCLAVGDPDETKREIKEGFERAVQEVLR